MIMKAHQCLLLLVSLCCSIDCIAARHPDEIGNVEGGQEEVDDQFYEEMLAGGEGERKRLEHLSPVEIVQEIKKLVGRIDEDGDSRLSKAELKTWLKRVEDHSYQTEADQLFEKEDANKDGYILFEEFWVNNEEGKLPTEGGNLDKTQANMMVRFQHADGNKDGRLDKKEFVPFAYPFRHDHMLRHLVEEQLGEYDYDHDGMISMEEFIQSLNPEHLPEEELHDWLEEGRVEFTENLDKDHDGFLDHGEIGKWVAPNEDAFFEEQIQHLMKHADKDKDGLLTVEEVEEEFDVFMDSSLTDYGHMVHEEL